MSADPRVISTRLLRDFAREPGRSALVRLETSAVRWEGGVAADEPRPAASLLKLPLTMAVERAFAAGDLDPDTPVAIDRLATRNGGFEPLRVLRAGLILTLAEVVGLCIALSHRTCACRLLDAVGVGAVHEVLTGLGCSATTAREDRGGPSAPLAGNTTARDAMRLLAASRDAGRHPLTANAVRNTVHNSRIPLAADDDDVRFAHKTGTLAGVANDVAILDCDGGTLELAFLSQDQHDTLVSGYEMGICTRGLLRAWGLRVLGSGSLL